MAQNLLHEDGRPVGIAGLVAPLRAEQQLRGQLLVFGRIRAGPAETARAHGERRAQIDNGDFEAAASLLFQSRNVVGLDVAVGAARLAHGLQHVGALQEDAKGGGCGARRRREVILEGVPRRIDPRVGAS